MKHKMNLMLLSPLLSLAIVCTGCSSSVRVEKAESTSEKTEPSAKPLESSPESESQEEALSVTEETQGKSSTEKSSTIEQVILDQDGIKIIAKDFTEAGNFLGPSLRIYAENNSNSARVIQFRDVSVNGFMIDPIFSIDIQPGKKANDSIDFMASDLKENGINQISYIELSPHIFSWDDWMDSKDYESVRIFVGDSHEEAVHIVDSSNEENSGFPILDTDGIKINALSMTEDIFGPALKIYVENNTNQKLTIQFHNVSVNGFMVDAIASIEIVPGKKAYDSITFMKTDLEKNGIDKIENIELSPYIFDSDSFLDYAEYDPVIVSLK